MKKYLLIVMLFGFAACNEHSEKATTKEGNTEEEKQPTIEEFCYYRTEGNNNEDSFLIKLIIEDSNVTGGIKYLPYEKDASVGTIKGTKEGNFVKLRRTYWQEGMEAIEPVSLKIDMDGVWEQQKSYNEQGEVYIDANAPYVHKYLPIDCSKFPERKY